MELKTPLYQKHLDLGGKIVPFGGYLLPVQYSGVIAEHMAVRTAAGVFDVSHMGEVTYSGPDALANLQAITCNDLEGMKDGQVRYSPICNDAGGVVDDLVVCRIDAEHFFVVVNAANRHKDVAWMKAHLFGDVQFADISDSVAQLAVQGPAATEIIRSISEAEELPVKYYYFTPKLLVAGIPCLVSRTGYTGERGFELYCAPADAPALWDAVLTAGAEKGLIPCGLGARDTLRLEAAMPLYGHEMTDEITPLEAGLDIFCKLDRGDFIGRAALLEKGEPAVVRVGLKVTGRGIAREHCDIYKDGERVGVVTSGTHAPYLGYAVAMAMLPKALSAEGTTVEVDVRGRRVEAVVVPLPFYKRSK